MDAAGGAPSVRRIGGRAMQRDAAFRSDVSAVRRFSAIAEKGGEKCGLATHRSRASGNLPKALSPNPLDPKALNN
jgi:hypothetical protein